MQVTISEGQSSTMHSFNNRPQFGRWLIQQVNSGRYEGLCWLDDQRTTFRIPWKHNSRKDCNDGDNMIFKEWAIVSGKIYENPNDKAKWKTNFRCALSSLKTQFKQLHDHSKESDDPHKVYQLVAQPEYRCSYENLPVSYPMIEDIYTENPADFSPDDIVADELWNHMVTLDLNPQADLQPWVEGYPPNNQVLPENYPLPPVGLPVEPPQQNNTPVAVVEPYYQASLLPPMEELEISIHYRRKEVLKTRVSAPVVQLHHQHEIGNLSGQAVCFPSTEGLLDHKQIMYTNRLLESIQMGLLLEVNHTGIYGTRQDIPCKVFVSTSNPAESQAEEPRKLVKNEREPLLSFEKFGKDLMEFKENKRGSPDYTIYLCFGEKYPDVKPLEKKLIVVKVVPLICREFHERAQMEGASSLNSGVSLQISHNSLFDLINSTFSLPMQE
ncbi:interferon regulatory factor 7 [Alosa sapidissima]|uniref:interferon regulatory factor 7 n=1 Tax=Alosa sapidissima TaxID=34773 RepID=UPI001C085CBF|nr:interferon regulatory factor 7 [Alosa sapidissima]